MAEQDISSLAAENTPLSRQTAIAGVWSIGARLLAKSFDFLSLIVLARLLGPGDFGLVAMAMTFIYVVESIFDLPLAAALARIHEPTPSMYNTAFTLGALRGGLIGLMLWLICWPISHFYNEPRLFILMLALAFAPILRGLVSPRMVIFARRMDFRRQATLDVTSKVIASISAIAMAALTHSYWAIAIGTIVTPTILMTGSYFFAPMRPRLTLKEWSTFADIVSWNLLTQLIQALNWQIGRFVLPRFVDTASFGRYAMSGDLAGMPLQTIVYPLLFPLNMAFVAAHKKGELKGVYLKAMGAVIIVIIPIYSFLGIVSDPLLRLFLGAKWEGAAPLLSGLSLATIILAPSIALGTLAITLNQSRQVTLRTLVQCMAVVPLTVLGVWHFGAMGAVMATCAEALIVTCMSLILVRKLIGATLGEQLAGIVGPVAAGGAAAIILYCAGDLIVPEGSVVMQFLEIVVLGLLYVASYVACLYVVSRWLKSTAGAEQMIISIALRTIGKFRRSPPKPPSFKAAEADPQGHADL